MEIRSAQFIASYPSETSCPKDGLPEFAFIGRSNVGKSSLINMLCRQKGLAKVSSTPGKTLLLNYFLINEKWYLVDLPGYGYAKVSKGKKTELSQMIGDYLHKRQSLLLAFLLIDVNIPPQKKDIEFINSLGEAEVPFALVFTKCDKESRSANDRNIIEFEKELSKTWEMMPPYFMTSSARASGRDEILSFIASMIKKKSV